MMIALVVVLAWAALNATCVVVWCTAAARIRRHGDADTRSAPQAGVRSHAA